jgi:hypothetical protein
MALVAIAIPIERKLVDQFALEQQDWQKMPQNRVYVY